MGVPFITSSNTRVLMCLDVLLLQPTLRYHRGEVSRRIDFYPTAIEMAQQLDDTNRSAEVRSESIEHQHS